ncbi:MAG TPA: biotin/lipoyl-binding protein, partial [Candidatus Baltobacteraceae bacterium]|nr:biotin/lipoyl-binding protein [Candidatus Baltobacteraceae bacterium]
MNRSVLAFAVVAVLAAAVLLAWFFRPRAPDGIQASGTIEARESDVAAKVQGRLVSLDVHDGDAVRKGQIVATLEQTTPALGVDQARANVNAAAAQVANAQSALELQRETYAMQVAQAGAGVSIARANMGQAAQTLGIETSAAALRVDQAKAQLSAAESAYVRARAELVRTQNLVHSGDEPQRALDDASAQYAAASAQLRAARDDLALALANRRNVQIREFGVQASGSAHRQSVAALDVATAQSEVIAERQAQLLAARAQLAQARAALGLARDQVRETRLVAPFDGYIVSHNFEVGDLVSPGSAVMTIADLRRPYLYVYIN